MIKRFIATLALTVPVSAFAQSLEQVPAGEAQAIADISQMVTQQVLDRTAGGQAARRDVHVKAHGCVRAEFQVEPNLPQTYAQGVFKTARTYPAWIRYSNGSERSTDDQTGDARGMAIKLMDVPGRKILAGQEDEKTQDFLLINHPVFFVRNAGDFVEFTRTLVATGSPVGFFFPGLNPLNWRLREADIARQITSKSVSNLLAEPYWSMTPYLLGQRAMKYAVAPCTADERYFPTDSADYLGDNLEAALAQRGACFNFYVQLQADAVSTPVEDATVEWTETQSPFKKVATLKIPKQSFRSGAQQEFCENVSMTPWHSLPEHRPLGGINRARRVVYWSVQKVRHEYNRAPMVEPTGSEIFE